MTVTFPLTPAQMLTRGVFGGSYFEMAVEPRDFLGLGQQVRVLARKNTGRYDASKNAYKVKAGLHYDEWMARGWIFDEDPLGWFHWYCRYHAGRRHPRDGHQIDRHHRYGERWGLRARNQLATTGRVSPVIKQGLLHWAFDPDQVIHGV